MSAWVGGEGWGIFGLEDLTFCCKIKAKVVDFVVTFEESFVPVSNGDP